MRVPEMLMLGALVGCQDPSKTDTGSTDSVPMGSGLAPYDSSPLTGSTPTGTGSPLDSGGTATGNPDTNDTSSTDTAEPAPSGEVSTTAALCTERLADLGLLDTTVYTPRIPSATPRIEATSGQMSDFFTVDFNGGSARPIFACAKFIPQDGQYVNDAYPVGTAEAVLGAKTVEGSDQHLEVAVEPLNPENGTMALFLGTQNEDGSFRGFTVPSRDSTEPARLYNVFWDDEDRRYVVLP